MPGNPDTKPQLIGAPELVCRWRLAGGRLPLAGRHLRALRARRVAGQPLPAPLVAWVAQQLEWALPASALEHPDGVLLLTVDVAGHAVLAVGPYEPLHDTSLPALVERARLSHREALQTGVAPETLWFIHDKAIVCAGEKSWASSGSATLVRDLAQAWNLNVTQESVPPHGHQELACKAAMLVSDEHGLVLASGGGHPRTSRFTDAYTELLLRYHK